MPTEITDPDLLRQLNGASQEVTDPQILAQLNGTAKRYGTGLSFDAQADGSLVPTGSQEAQAGYSPVSGSSFLQNTVSGVGKLYTDAVLGARQISASPLAQAAQVAYDPLGALFRQAQPEDTAALQQQATEKRAIDAPLAATAGGKVGQVLGALPLAFVPGANTYTGAALLGGGMGALQPTVGGESRALNTGVGAGLGIAGKAAGDALSNWITTRAAQPFMGWNQNAGNEALARAVGSDQSELDQAAIGMAKTRFDQIFTAARSPDVTVPVTDSAVTALESAGNKLNSSSRTAFYANDQVKDLISHLGSTPTAEQLGSLSSKLGKEAAGEMSGKMGDRELGQALFAVKDHIDELIGSSITDPALKATYNAALPQYRTFLNVTRRPTLLNSTTGDVNLRNLGNYLQRYDAGFREGTNTSELYQAARFGQASTIGSRPPPPILQPFKFAAYHALNNPVIGAVGGMASRAGVPFNPLLRSGLPGIGSAATGTVLLPYLEQ